MSPLYPASFSTPCVTPIFWGKPSFGSSRRTCQIRLICEWDFGLTCLADPHGPEKSCLPKRPSKMAQRGLIWERGGISLLRLPKPHIGPHKRDNGGPSGCAANWSSGFLLFRGHSKKFFSLFMWRSFCIGRIPPTGYSNNVLQNVIRVLDGKIALCKNCTA